MIVQLNDGGLGMMLSKDVRQAVAASTTKTLNKMSFTAMNELRAVERSSLDLTRNFIPASTQYDQAVSDGLSFRSEVGILERVKFAERLVDGGNRTPVSHSYIAVPANGKGSARKPASVLRQRGTFIKEIGGTLGIYKKIKRRLKLLYVLKPITHYNKAPYLDFDGVINKVVERTDFEGSLVQSALKALGM